MSPIVLVKHVDAINDDNEDPLEPMRYEKGKITPNLAGVVPPGAKGVSLFFILHPDPKSTEPVDAGDGSKSQRASGSPDSATTEGE